MSSENAIRYYYCENHKSSKNKGSLEGYYLDTQNEFDMRAYQSTKDSAEYLALTESEYEKHKTMKVLK